MSASAPHFVLVGHVGSQNRGCEALVRTTVGILSEEWPEARFTLASWYPEQDGPLASIANLEIMPGFEWPVSRGPLAKRIGRKLGRMLGVTPRKPASGTFPRTRFLRETFQSADLVISIGGDNYTEYYGPPFYFMELLEHAHALGKKTVIWGASIGPFDDRGVRSHMTALLQDTGLITIRDEWTAQYLDGMGIRGPKIVRVADTAFLMPPRKSERVRLPASPHPLVGFNGSGILHRYVSGKRGTGVIAELVAFLQLLVDQDGVSLLLVPHETTPASFDNDWTFLYWLQRMIDRPGRLSLLPPGLDAPETKAAIGCCDLFIGMRMHAIVAALSQAIPTLALSYSPKFVGLMESTLGHANYLMDYQKIVASDLHELYAGLWGDRKRVHQTLAERLPAIRAKAKIGVQAVKTLLEGH